MGRPTSLRIHHADGRITVTGRTRSTLDEMASLGIPIADNPRDVARNAEIIILTLVDASSVREVLAENPVFWLVSSRGAGN